MTTHDAKKLAEELEKDREKLWKALDTTHQHAANMQTRVEAAEEVVGWAQALLTALNTGDVPKDSMLHLKLREALIAYREIADGQD